MRLFGYITWHCQSCVHGNNDKGKFIYHWYRKGITYDYNYKGKLKRDLNKEGYWNIFCEKKEKFFAWNTRKCCFEKKEKGADILFHNSFEKRFRDLLLSKESRAMEKRIMELSKNKTVDEIVDLFSLSKEEIAKIIRSYETYEHNKMMTRKLLEEIRRNELNENR